MGKSGFLPTVPVMDIRSRFDIPVVASWATLAKYFVDASGNLNSEACISSGVPPAGPPVFANDGDPEHMYVIWPKEEAPFSPPFVRRPPQKLVSLLRQFPPAGGHPPADQPPG